MAFFTALFEAFWQAFFTAAMKNPDGAEKLAAAMLAIEALRADKVRLDRIEANPSEIPVGGFVSFRSAVDCRFGSEFT